MQVGSVLGEGVLGELLQAVAEPRFRSVRRAGDGKIVDADEPIAELDAKVSRKGGRHREVDDHGPAPRGVDALRPWGATGPRGPR